MCVCLTLSESHNGEVWLTISLETKLRLIDSLKRISLIEENILSNPRQIKMYLLGLSKANKPVRLHYIHTVHMNCSGRKMVRKDKFCHLIHLKLKFPFNSFTCYTTQPTISQPYKGTGA